MYDFVAIAKAVDNQMDGTFKTYHIEELKIKETKYITKVTAIVMNDWTKTRNIFKYEWSGSTLENISVKIDN